MSEKYFQSNIPLTEDRQFHEKMHQAPAFTLAEQKIIVPKAIALLILVFIMLIPCYILLKINPLVGVYS